MTEENPITRDSCRELMDASEEQLLESREKLCVAISLAEIGGFDATKDALVELLRALEESRMKGAA